MSIKVKISEGNVIQGPWKQRGSDPIEGLSTKNKYTLVNHVVLTLHSWLDNLYHEEQEIPYEKLELVDQIGDLAALIFELDEDAED